MKNNFLPVWATGLLLSFSLLTSCKEELEQTTPVQPETIAITDSSGTAKKGTFRGMPITYKVIDGRAIWQGDILVTPEDLAGGSTPNARIAGAGASDKFYRWPNGVIPYEIASNVGQAELNQINDAIAYWQDQTSIDFVPRTNQADYVRFVVRNVNESEIGKKGGMQEIKLIKNVNRRAVVHEIGHAVGLLHEHTRSDRDNWITVKWENVNDEGKDELLTYATKYPWYGTFGNEPVDFKSVMIYSATAYSKNGQATMVRKDNGSTWPAQDELSGTDVNTVERMYANLYIVQGKKLYSANAKTGAWAKLGNGDWTGAAKGIAEDDRYIWAVQGGTLWRTDRFTGDFQAMGNEDWSGPVVGLTGAEPGGFYFAQQGKRLWKIGGNGKRVRLGGLQALEDWSGTQAIYNHNGALYVIWKNTLYKINLSTGKVDQTYPGVWFDVKGMAAPYQGSQSIYVVNANDLYRVDTVTGAMTLVRSGFKYVTAMSGVGGSLYMVTGNDLYRVTEDGYWHYLSSGWAGASSMGAIHNANGLN
jgi:hypothetical protein